MKCDLCNGELEIQAGGKAVCTVCGTHYSPERLREKIGNISGTHAEPKVNNSNLDTKLRMAESALRQNNKAKAVEYCEEVLAADYYNMRAWRIKIEALCKTNYEEKVVAADCMAEACSLIKDEKEREKFIEELWSSFVEEDPFKKCVAQTAEKLLQVDKELAEDYLYMIISRAAFSVKDSCKARVKDLRDMNAEAASDARYYVLMGKSWNNCMSWMTEYIDHAETLMKLAHRGVRADTELKNLVEAIADAQKAASSILSSREDIRVLARRASELCLILSNGIHMEEQRLKKEKQAAINKYWQEHPEKREELENQRRALKEKISQIQKEISAKDSNDRCQMLEKEVDAVTQELRKAGLFEFKKKKELNQKWQELEQQLSAEQKKLESEQEKLEKKIASLNQQIKSIDQKIADPAI